jgi:general secretion pathway protein G
MAELGDCLDERAVRVVDDAMAKERRRTRGFTLVELLVVLVILGLIATLAAPQVIKFLGGAQRDTAALQVDKLSGILDLYRLEVGTYPTTEVGLSALIERPAGAERWNGPYLRKAKSLTDPWGNPYIYRHPGDHGEYDLYSLGKDGREGGEGENQDITNW